MITQMALPNVDFDDVLPSRTKDETNLRGSNTDETNNSSPRHVRSLGLMLILNRNLSSTKSDFNPKGFFWHRFGIADFESGTD